MDEAVANEAGAENERGRPRDRQRQEAVLIATRQLLADTGYSALNFSQVATAAGVGRQLLYRWWPTKQDLVAEALFGRTDPIWPSRYRGPLERDLRAFVTALVDYADRPDVRAGVTGLIADVRGRPEPLPFVQDGFIRPLQRSFAHLLDEGRRRGEVRADVDTTMLLDTIRGAVTLHVLDVRRPRRKVVDHLVALLLPALAAK